MRKKEKGPWILLSFFLFFLIIIIPRSFSPVFVETSEDETHSMSTRIVKVSCLCLRQAIIGKQEAFLYKA